MVFDITYFKEIAQNIFNVDSPSGYSEKINKILSNLNIPSNDEEENN